MTFEERVLSGLGDLKDEVGTVKTTVAVLASTLSQHRSESTDFRDEFRSSLEQHSHTIYGNGRPGLTTAISDIESKVALLNRLAWFAVSGILSASGGTAIYLLLHTPA